MAQEQPPSPEILDEKFGELLLSGELAGEGGRAIIIKLSADHVSPELKPAFESLNSHKEQEDKAVKLFKLYLPNKGKNEYEIHSRLQEMLEEVPKDEKKDYARVPELSSSRDIALAPDLRHRLEEKFQLHTLGERSILIAMEYIDGEDLATIFYKWILEREGTGPNQIAFTPQKTDSMDFGHLYLAVAQKLDLEDTPSGDSDVPEAVLEQAEWKVSQKNASKIYAYLRKNNFPMPPEIAIHIENTLKLMHRGHMTHGDAFERNIMVTGGTKALREKGTLEGEETVLIDFGESRDHFVEQVDDFNVVRRLKTLSISREEEMKLKKNAELEEITAKSERLNKNTKWQAAYVLAREQMRIDKTKALSSTWNNTAGYKEDGIEDFFIIAKTLIGENILDNATLDTFVEEKRKERMTPYRKNLLNKCVDWLNSQ